MAPKLEVGEKTCKYCGRLFYPLVYWQIYCDRDCKMGAHFERKRQAKRSSQPTDFLDLNDPPTEPTEAQQADRQRRVEGREVQSNQQHADDVVRIAMERGLLKDEKITRTLDDLYGPEKDKS